MEEQVIVSFSDKFIEVNHERYYLEFEGANIPEAVAIPFGVLDISWTGNTGDMHFADNSHIALDESNYNAQIQPFVDLWAVERDIQLGVEVELTIEDARFERMTWLQTMIDATLDLSVIDSSLGFPINTNMQSLNDIVNFMVLLTDEGLENVAYHDANDEEHILDADEMRVLHGELSDFISGVSRKARILRGIINSAESFAELAQVQWDFVDISRLGGKRRGKRLLNNLI